MVAKFAQLVHRFAPPFAPASEKRKRRDAIGKEGEQRKRSVRPFGLVSFSLFFFGVFNRLPK